MKTELSTVNETVGADKPREPKATSKRLSLAVTGKEAGQNYSGVSDDSLGVMVYLMRLLSNLTGEMDRILTV